MFPKRRPYIRQAITNEGISRIGKIDKAEAAQTWAIPQIVAATIFYSSPFLHKCLWVAVSKLL